MRILSVHPDPTIASRLVDLLIGSLALKDAHFALVSPWMSDFEVSLASRGLFLPQLGSERRVILFSELVCTLARENDVAVVMRPPHVLIGRGDLARIVDLLRTRAELGATLASDLSVRNALILLEQETERLVAGATSHRGTVQFARAISDAPRVKLTFNPRLHAKVVVTPAAALVGSANLTWSGMHSNDEIMLQVDDPDGVASLAAAASVTAQRPFSTAAAAYDFRLALPAQERDALDALLANPVAPPEFLAFLRDCLFWQTQRRHRG